MRATKTVGRRKRAWLRFQNWKRAAAELTPQDLIDNVVVKIADEVEVDVSTRAWKVSYADAVGTLLKTTIDGVEIPYLDLETLIKSKSTKGDQDRVDVQRLRQLARGTST